MIVSWCNGSTTGFGSVCRGSNPRETTEKERLTHRVNLFFFIHSPQSKKIPHSSFLIPHFFVSLHRLNYRGAFFVIIKE